MWITGNPVQRLVLVFDYVLPWEAKEICPPEAHCLSFILCSQPTPVFLPGKSHGRRSMVGYSPWGRKESDTTEQIYFTQYWNLGTFCQIAVCQPSGIMIASSLGSIFGERAKDFRSEAPILYKSHCNLQSLQVFGTCLGTLFVESILRVKAANRKAESRNQGRVSVSSFESQVQLCVKQDWPLHFWVHESVSLGVFSVICNWESCVSQYSPC